MTAKFVIFAKLVLLMFFFQIDVCGVIFKEINQY